MGKEIFDFEKTKDLEVTDIFNLIENMEFLKSDEFLHDIYSIRYILNQYAGMPDGYPLRGIIEHAPQLSKLIAGGFSIHPSLPSIVCSKFRVELIESVEGNNGAYAIGPHIAYVNHAYTEEKIAEEKKRLGKTLLVFPAHSIQGLEAKYDFEEFINEIKLIGKDFDSIRICLFWKDILEGKYKYYLDNEFELVTAGNFYDPLFLPRLKTIIETSTITMSNSLGTHVGYCVFMKKPHYIYTSNVNLEKSKTDGEKISNHQYKFSQKFKKSLDNDEDITDLIQTFSIYRENISKKQYDFINYYWGIDQIKSKREIRDLIYLLDGRYAYNHQADNNTFFRQANEINSLKAKLYEQSDLIKKQENKLFKQNLLIESQFKDLHEKNKLIDSKDKELCLQNNLLNSQKIEIENLCSQIELNNSEKNTNKFTNFLHSRFKK